MALVVFVVVAPCADASLIFLKMFGIPNAPNPTNKEPAPASFMKSLLVISIFLKIVMVFDHNSTQPDVSIKVLIAEPLKNKKIKQMFKW